MAAHGEASTWLQLRAMSPALQRAPPALTHTHTSTPTSATAHTQTRTRAVPLFPPPHLVHHRHHACHQVAHVLEGARLGAIAVERQWLAAQRLQEGRKVLTGGSAGRKRGQARGTPSLPLRQPRSSRLWRAVPTPAFLTLSLPRRQPRRQHPPLDTPPHTTHAHHRSSPTNQPHLQAVLAWATKLDTTRPSSNAMRGPYVLKIRTMRICRVNGGGGGVGIGGGGRDHGRQGEGRRGAGGRRALRVVRGGPPGRCPPPEVAICRS
jgi:hypothetical protein